MIPAGTPCKNGHPYDRNPSGNCRPCARIKCAESRERQIAGTAWKRGGDTCRNGHPREDGPVPADGCRICSRETSRRAKARARAARAPRARAPRRPCGHEWSDRTRTKPDCGSCNRARAKRYADAKRGAPPRVIDPDKFPCGHDRLTETRPGKNTCAPCHKAREAARYWADPVANRAKVIAYQKANRAGANERTRRFRERNPGYDAARKYAPDQETRAWLEVIAADPCSYCGEPSNAVDHILAVSRGGANHWTNFAPTCRACNSSKRDRALLPWLLAFRSEIPA